MTYPSHNSPTNSTDEPKIETETYRAVYLSLDMQHLDSEPAMLLLERHLELLLGDQEAPIAAPAQLEISSLLAPELQRPGPVTAALVVANKGGRPSEPFGVRYRLRRDSEILEGELVASGEVSVAAIPAYSDRDLTLPVLADLGDGSYQLEVELLVGDDDRPLGIDGPGSTAGVSEGFSREIRVIDDLLAPFVGANLDDVGGGNGATLIDYDGDGDLDLYLLRLGRPNKLFRNDADRFVEAAEEAGLRVTGNSRSLAAADYDGDGDLDVYLVSEGANRFFDNEGEGFFREVTAELSADSLNDLADPGSGRSSGFFDPDGDGDLDLYVVNDGGENRYYANEEGLFRESGEGVGLADTTNGRGLTFADFDSDGDTDLFLANNSGGSRLYRNDSGSFADATAVVGLELIDGDVSGVFGDYDNDGDADLFVANQLQQNRLYRREVFGSFVDVTEERDLDLGKQSVSAVFIDYDSDGDFDLLTSGLSKGVPDQLYHNVGSGMVGVGKLVGLAQRTVGRGITFGDLDADGDEDLFLAADTSRVYLNSTVGASRLEVRLRALGLNPDGIGAVVDVVAGELRQTRELQPTFGYCSQGPLSLQFGLGATNRVDTLRVWWADGQVSVQTDMPAGQIELEHPEIVARRQPPLPTAFRLFANFPNPFNAGTQIAYQLPGRSSVELTVFNASGQLVRRLFKGELESGTHRIVWDGLDGAGRQAGSGVYVYRLRAGDWVRARKMVLVQ